MARKKVILFSFLLLIFGLFVANIKVFSNAIFQVANESYNIKDVPQLINSYIKDNFWKKTYFIDGSGVCLKLLNKNTVGNFEYIKDLDGNMHMSSYISGEDSFVDSMLSLAEICQQKNTPLVYIQAPQREKSEQSFIGEYRPNNTLDVSNYIKAKLQNTYIDYLDIQNFENLVPGEIYFKTDAHMTTESEFNILKDTIKILEARYGIEFNQTDTNLNLDNFEIISRDFVGNFARSVGSMFTDIDTFDMYIPKYDTSFSTYDENNNLISSGSFEEALMNHYETDPNSNKYSYWVTNYGHFMKPKYVYDNLKYSDGPNVLVICDSQAMRFFSYLSLVCDSVTIQDPRYDPYGNILSSLITNNQYDVVIVMQDHTLIGTKFLYDYDLDAEIISHNAPEIVKNTGSYQIKITVKNTGKSSWSEADQIRLCIWQDSADWGYRLYLPEGVTVEPGEEYTFTLEGFVLPEAEQTTLEFQMLQEGVQYFGEREPVLIKVGYDGGM